MSTPIRRLAMGLLLSSALVACTGSASTSPSSTPSDVASSQAPGASTASDAPSESSVPTDATDTAVSASSASHAELVTALEAAGVPNADRWASEIEEYRPYDAADTFLQKLQDNLAKYNPDAATLAAILSALVP